MHATDTLLASSGLMVARVATQGQGSGARHPIAMRTEAGASVAARRPHRCALADAIAAMWAEQHVARRDGRPVVFRADGSAEVI